MADLERKFQVQTDVVRAAIRDVWEDTLSEHTMYMAVDIEEMMEGKGPLTFEAPEEIQDAVDDRLYVKRTFRI